MSNEQKPKETAPTETYVSRTERELADLGKVSRKNWKLAALIVLILAAFGAYEIGLFHKKDDAKDATEETVKVANQLAETANKYQTLLIQNQEKQNAENDEQLRFLKAQLDAQARGLSNRAQQSDGVIVPDPRVYGGVRLISAAAVNAWTKCVQTEASSGARDTIGPFSIGGSSSNSDNRCDEMLQQMTDKSKG
jgi:hypothetical protein